MFTFILNLKKLFWQKIRGADLIQKSKAYDILAMDFLDDLPDKPFNNQLKRTGIINTLFNEIKFEQIIETGSYLCATSRYLAKLSDENANVISIELDKLYYAFNKKNSLKHKNLRFINNSSEHVLNKHDKYNISLDLSTFFYLDAHWYNYLPLRDELKK